MDKHIKQKGFILIEVIISIAILCILAVPFISITYSAATNNIISGSKVKATETAQAVMEWYKARGVYGIDEIVQNTDSIVLLYFIKDSDLIRLSDILEDYKEQLYYGLNDISEFEQIDEIAIGKSLEYDYAVKVILNIRNDDRDNRKSAIISVTVWNKINNYHTKVTLVSLECE